MLLAGLVSHLTFAQYSRSGNGKLTIGTTYGYTFFHGDIEREGVMPDNTTGKKDFGTAQGIQIGFPTENNHEFRLNVYRGSLNGVRNVVAKDYEVYFTNDYWEYGGSVVFDIFSGRKNWSLKGTGGLGFISYRSRQYKLECGSLAHYTGYNAEMKPEARTTDMVISGGFELAYRLNKFITIKAEHVYRFASSSQLDAVATGGFNDGYSYTAIGFSTIIIR